MKLTVFAATGACALLAGCAAAPGDSALVAPPPVADAYSKVDLQIALATARGEENRCVESECDARADFDQRVALLGGELGAAAARQYPELATRVPRFEFSVADKSEPATLSTADGKIVVFRPVSGFTPRDPALAFVLAREMGHVIARHHERNTGLGLAVSALVQVLFPVIGVTQLFANALPVAAAGAGVGASGAANASVNTAGSLAVSRAVVASYRPQQIDEADAIALKLLAQLGYDAGSVGAAFDAPELGTPDSGWMSALRKSVEKIAPPSPAPPAVEAKAGS